VSIKVHYVSGGHICPFLTNDLKEFVKFGAEDIYTELYKENYIFILICKYLQSLLHARLKSLIRFFVKVYGFYL
jgi:hypothetical protein